ncbi:hypothetical protein H7X65_02880 [Candidatus Parcubacteria bacterium]|nr:hypothetical protein [Candidatus Parcubacteria bacterium]
MSKKRKHYFVCGRFLKNGRSQFSIPLAVKMFIPVVIRIRIHRGIDGVF